MMNSSSSSAAAAADGGAPVGWGGLDDAAAALLDDGSEKMHAFDSFEAFVSAMKQGGTSALEIVSRDMKVSGRERHRSCFYMYAM